MTEDKKTPQQWSTIYQNKIQRRISINTRTTRRHVVISKVNGTYAYLCLGRDEIVLGIKIKLENMSILMQMVLVVFQYSFPFPQPVLLRLIVVFLPLPPFFVFPFDRTMCYAIIFIRIGYAHITVASIRFSGEWFKFVLHSRISIFSMSRTLALVKCSLFSSATQHFHVCLQTSTAQHSFNLHDEILETLHIKLLS